MHFKGSDSCYYSICHTFWRGSEASGRDHQERHQKNYILLYPRHKTDANTYDINILENSNKYSSIDSSDHNKIDIVPLQIKKMLHKIIKQQ